MKTYVISLMPILVTHREGVELVAAAEQLEVEAANAAFFQGLDGDHLILKDSRNTTVFSAMSKDVRYCHVKNNIKGLLEVAVNSIQEGETK